MKSILIFILTGAVVAAILVVCDPHPKCPEAKMQAPPTPQAVESVGKKQAREGVQSDRPVMILNDAATAYGDAGYDRSRN